MMIALTPRIPICRTAQYFNPHFRKGSDKIATGFPIERVISIHTSAREVTDGEWWEKDICRFQSTLPQGKWRQDGHADLPYENFNPHFRKGSDSDSNHGDQQVFHFNPHFRKGSDRFLIFCLRLLNIFQSTLPQGKWLVTPYKVVSKGHFNPHFRKGSDLSSFRHPLKSVISIHTSAREVTPCTLRLLTLLQISIHTSAREVTQHKTKVQNIFSHFNPHFRKGSDGQDIDWTATEDDISIHTSAREVTAKVRVRIMPKPISIHTSAREVTCSLDHWMHRKPYFNPHFRKGSDFEKSAGEDYMFRISIHTSAREVTVRWIPG